MILKLEQVKSKVPLTSVNSDSHFDSFVSFRVENSHGFYHSQTHLNTTYRMIILNRAEYIEKVFT